MSNLQSAAQAYRVNQVNTASPLGLLLMAYDAALIGCGQRDLDRTTRALSVLRYALDFSYSQEIAMGLFRLYQYCAELARQGDYEQAADILRELRATWVQAKDNLMGEASQAVGNAPPEHSDIPAGSNVAAYIPYGARGPSLMTALS